MSERKDLFTVGARGACPCGVEDAARYPDARDRVAVPTSPNCPIHYCDGSSECSAVKHLHGCFADHGNCDHPSEYHGAPYA